MNMFRREQLASWVTGRAISHIETPSRATKTDRKSATCATILSNYAGVEVARPCGSRGPVIEYENRRPELNCFRLSDSVSRHGLPAFYAVVCDIPVVGAAYRAFPAQKLHPFE
jgi:hypothetical protein